MCFSVLALYCKQSKMGVKSNHEQWLKKVKCAAGLDKIWVCRVSNTFCDQALSQNSFSGHPALLPSPNAGAEAGQGESSYSFLPESLCFALRLGSVWVTLPTALPVQQWHVRGDTEPVSCPHWRSMSCFLLQLPGGASPFPHLTWQLCCSWCETRLLGFSCLKLHHQTGLALGNRFFFLPCTGYNWPRGAAGRRWGRTRTC